MNLEFTAEPSAKFGTSSGMTLAQKQKEAAAQQEAQRRHELKLACLNGGRTLQQCGLETWVIEMTIFNKSARSALVVIQF